MFVRRSPRPWKKRKVLRSVDPLVAVLQVLVGLLVVHERSTVRPTVRWKQSSYSCNSKGVRQVGIKKRTFAKFFSKHFLWPRGPAPWGIGWWIGWLGLISKGCAIIESSSTRWCAASFCHLLRTLGNCRTDRKNMWLWPEFLWHKIQEIQC